MSNKTKLIAMPKAVLHAYNRGLNRSQIFFGDEDYEGFMEMTRKAIRAGGISLLAFTLIPNHFHLIVRQSVPYAVSDFLKGICQPFVKRMNGRLARSGHLFGGRYKVGNVPDPESLLRLSRYVHLNPVRASLVKDPGDWKFSSYRTYVDDVQPSLADPGLIFRLVGGREGYGRFLAGYDPSNPDSALRFILDGRREDWLDL